MSESINERIGESSSLINNYNRVPVLSKIASHSQGKKFAKSGKENNAMVNNYFK